MVEVPQGWEIVSRHAHYGWFMTLLGLVLTGLPQPSSRMMIRLRETSSGRLYSITAYNDIEAMEKLAHRDFD